ncbi:MAG: hypothetical protein FIA99_19275 [Ruminiclostridium sp.]|nr:hypothetical protein [Ruminiclostridium sp.]
MDNIIKEIHQNSNDLVEIEIRQQDNLISCQVFYRIGEEEWKYASIYSTLDKEYELNGNGYLWHQEQSIGTVRLYGRDLKALYWNKYLNVRNYTGPAAVKVIFITTDREYEEVKILTLKNVGVLYLDDWSEILGNECTTDPHDDSGKWLVIKNPKDNYIVRPKDDQSVDIRIPLKTEGKYDIYFGLKNGGAWFLARLQEENFSTVMTQGSGMCQYDCNYFGKENKEIFWKTAHIRGGYLGLRRLKKIVPGDPSFAGLSYVKLVPHSKPVVRKVSCKYLILYYEPYSYTPFGFHDAENMNGIMLNDLLRLNPDEITCQTVRIGMKSLHYSKIVERVDSNSITDENTIISDPVELVKNCDILEESIRYMKGRKIKITANVGMNRPYIWDPGISEKFARENPRFIKDGSFDFNFSEVRDYAMDIIGEIIDRYDIDGICLDYLRYFENQTEETLTDIISRVKDRLLSKENRTGKALNLKVRIPADQIVYYRAMTDCVKHGWTDGIILSNLATSEPLPPVQHYQHLCKGTMTKVYGCIDGWKKILLSEPRAGDLGGAYTPKDVAGYFKQFEKLRTDGVFVYQGDVMTTIHLRPLFECTDI